MNAYDASLPPVRGLIDRDGDLAAADPRLHDLNARAGGAIGAPLAVPQIATLARLAARLRILVARNVTVADGDHDLAVWVRAEPGEEGVSLAITGWRARDAWRPSAHDGERSGDFLRAGADWLWETDAALRLTFISDDAGARHGFDAATLLGEPLTRLFALGEDGDGGFPILGRLATRQRFDGQRAILRSTGRTVRIDAAPRTDRTGAFAGFFGATHVIDVPLPAPDRDLPKPEPDAFGARLDRALRRPLGRIIANADSIHGQTEGPLPQDYADYAADIASAGRHLIGLVDDLVDLQAIERPDFTVAAEPIDLADIARRAAGLLAVRAADSQVRIDRPDPLEALPATGEFRRALQILVNLVGNAVRYSPPGGMVWIRIERAGDTATVTVADQGKGIAAEDQARIFDKFERIDPREPGGSGLGLYIARRLARAMRGDVTVESAPGQGARFMLTLPYRES